MSASSRLYEQFRIEASDDKPAKKEQGMLGVRFQGLGCRVEHPASVGSAQLPLHCACSRARK